MLFFTDILIDALLRATYAQGLRWRSPGDHFAVVSTPAAERIADAFRFDDDDPWLETEASANAPTHEIPQIRIRVAVPALGLTREAGLQVANDVNRHGLASVCFDAPAEVLVVQQSLVFTGYHDVNPLDIDAGTTFVQREATLNMLSAILATCDACLRRLRPEKMLPRQYVRQLRNVSPQALELFSTFVLVRMYRWCCADLERDGPAFGRLREAMVRCMTEEALDLSREAQPEPRPDRQAATKAAQRRIDAWLQERLAEHRADDPHFDSLLFGVDRRLRQELRDEMVDPPNVRPLRQLVMLERALVMHGTLWRSARITARSLRHALALGMDVAVANVPEGYVQRLQERFPFLTPAAAASSYEYPESAWLTGGRTPDEDGFMARVRAAGKNKAS